MGANDAVAYFQSGEAHFQNGNAAMAIADLTKAIERDPNFARAYCLRGLAYDQQELNIDNAIADYSHAIRLKPDYAVAYFDRADAYYRKKIYDKALEDCKKVIQIDPAYDHAYHLMGVISEQLDKTNDIIENFTKYIELNGGKETYDESTMAKMSGAYHDRAVAYINLGNIKQAVADLETSVKIDPNNAGAKDLLGKLENDGAAQEGSYEADGSEVGIPRILTTNELKNEKAHLTEQIEEAESRIRSLSEKLKDARNEENSAESEFEANWKIAEVKYENALRDARAREDRYQENTRDADNNYELNRAWEEAHPGQSLNLKGPNIDERKRVEDLRKVEMLGLRGPGYFISDAVHRRRNRASDHVSYLETCINTDKQVFSASTKRLNDIDALLKKTPEQRTEEHYQRLLLEKKSAMDETSLIRLAGDFREMEGYKDTAALARDCDNQYRSLKERREESERLEAKRKQRERTKADRRAKTKKALKLSFSMVLGMVITGIIFWLSATANLEGKGGGQMLGGALVCGVVSGILLTILFGCLKGFDGSAPSCGCGIGFIVGIVLFFVMIPIKVSVGIGVIVGALLGLCLREKYG